MLSTFLISLSNAGLFVFLLELCGGGVKPLADDAEHVDRFNPAEEFRPVVQQTDADRRRTGDPHHPRAAQLAWQRSSRSWTRHF